MVTRNSKGKTKVGGKCAGNRAELSSKLSLRLVMCGVRCVLSMMLVNLRYEWETNLVDIVNGVSGTKI